MSSSDSGELARFGISVGRRGFVSFEIEESDPQWPELAGWIKRRRAVDVAQTKFSNAELSAASWLEMVPAWHHGYPQPDEDSFGYLKITYDLADYCQTCGIGLRQVAPFQVRGEPRWSRNEILQLNWVFDELFVTSELRESVFLPLGIGRRVVLGIDGRELTTVVQLEVEEQIGLLTENLTPLSCAVCGRIKYGPPVRGRFPTLASAPVAAVAKTSLWFGTGASASRRLIASNVVRRMFTRRKVRGISFRPVDE